MSKACDVEEEIYPHEYLWRSSTAVAVRLESSADDAHHLLLPALLATFFAYEAFVNFCGLVHLPDLWSREKENFKGKSLEYKVELIASGLPGFVWRKGERPYQTVSALCGLRELAAHGKVQVTRYAAEQKSDGTHFRFQHAWDSYLSQENVLLARADTQAFCESLLVALRRCSEHPHLAFPAFEGSLASGESLSRVGS